MISPWEALQRAMHYITGLCSQQTLNQPGAVIQRLSPETRQALQGLKSDDIGSDKQDLQLKYYINTREQLQEEEYRKDRLNFDKKILK
jgi:hypothetical protein